jgi:hypothetical protein
MLSPVPESERQTGPPMAHVPSPQPCGGQPRSQSIPQGPQYVRRRSWFKALVATVEKQSCSTCGGGSYTGWIQRQIETPGRIKRWLLWWVNLVPKGASFIRVVTGGFVSADEFMRRQGKGGCADCPGATIRLKMLPTGMRELSYCELCGCPKWWFSRNKVANWFKKRGCPLNRHPTKDPNTIYIAYVEAKRVGVMPHHPPIDREPPPTPAPPPISNCQCDKKSKTRGSGKKS